MVNSGIALEVVSTECLRADVAIHSWSSLVENLTGVDWSKSTLYLNIDPIPVGRRDDHGRMTDWALRMFGRVVYRWSTKPHFTRAVKWGWMQPVSLMFLYWQADWLLLGPVAMSDVLGAMGPRYAALNLMKEGADVGAERICLSPLFIRTGTARAIAANMEDRVGPEAQLRPPDFRPGGRSLAVGLYSRHWPDKPIVRDIGREWREERGITLKGGTSFVTWEVPDGEARPVRG